LGQTAQSVGWAIGHGGLILAAHALLGFALATLAFAAVIYVLPPHH
jgi:hypothetical protein